MDEDDDNKQVKRVNFADGDDDDTGEEFLFEKEEEDVQEEVVQEEVVRKPRKRVVIQDESEEEEEPKEEELSEMEKIRQLSSIICMSVAFDEEDVALLASQKAQLLKEEVKKRTSTKALARDHFQNTIDEREKVLTDAVRQGLLVPGSDTFLFFVKKQAKLVDLAQKLY
jgi:epoxyqueuosine reductase QueG